MSDILTLNYAQQNFLMNRKALSILGARGQIGLNEWFMDVADTHDPLVSKWITTQDNDGAVQVITDEAINFCRVYAGSVAADDSVINTRYLYQWNFNNADSDSYSTLKFKTKFLVEDLEGEFGLGLNKTYTIRTADEMDAVTSHAMCLHGDNDVVSSCTSDGTTLESNDLSAYLTEGVYSTLEVIFDGTDAKFYIDDTLRATHDTNLPNRTLSFVAATKNTNGVQTDLKLQYVQVWTE